MMHQSWAIEYTIQLNVWVTVI